MKNRGSLYFWLCFSVVVDPNTFEVSDDLKDPRRLLLDTTQNISVFEVIDSM